MTQVIEFDTEGEYSDFLLAEGFPTVGFNALTRQPAPSKQQTVRPFRKISAGGRVYLGIPDDNPASQAPRKQGEGRWIPPAQAESKGVVFDPPEVGIGSLT